MKKIALLFMFLAGCQTPLMLGSYPELEVHTTEGSNFGPIRSLSNRSISKRQDEPIKSIRKGRQLFDTRVSRFLIKFHEDSLGLGACQVELFQNNDFRRHLKKIIESSATWADQATPGGHQIDIEIILTQRRSFKHDNVSIYLNNPNLTLAFSLGELCASNGIKAKLIDSLAQTMHEIVHVGYLLKDTKTDELSEEKSAYRVQYCSALGMDNDVQISIPDYISSATSVQELTNRVLRDTGDQETAKRSILANAIVLFELSSKANSKRLKSAALSGPLNNYCLNAL